MNDVALRFAYSSNSNTHILAMSRPISLCELRGANRAEIGRLDGTELLIGREAQEGRPSLAVPSQAISREHGLFSAIGKFWFYKDLGSTNGSWLNGVPLEKDKWKLVRVGDVLQVADLAIELVDDSHGQAGNYAGPGVRSLIVFSRGDFLEEYPIPEYGRALVVGGSKADLRLDVDVHELPSLVIERRGDNVVAFTISKETPVLYNDKEISHPMNLKDRDEVRIAHYQIVFNGATPQARVTESLATAPRGSETSVAASAHESDEFVASTRNDWLGSGTSQDFVEEEYHSELTGNRSARVSERIPFGKTMSKDFNSDETIAIDAAEVQARISGYDVHPAMRHTLTPTSSGSFDALEDKVILGIGLLMLLGLVVLVGWWVLS